MKSILCLRRFIKNPPFGGNITQLSHFEPISLHGILHALSHLDCSCEDRTGPDRSDGRGFHGKSRKIVAASRSAAEQGARLTVFSELAICGYPPADFLEKPSFLARCRSAVDELAAATRELPTAVLAGVALPAGGNDGKTGPNSRRLQRRCAPRPGQLLLEQHKRLLPFYDVFDEQRYFSPSEPQKVIELDGIRLAITICEDAWNDKNFWPRRLYTVDPMEELMRQHPALHINLSSSPFWHSKRAIRREMLAAIARRDAIPVLM